MPALTAETHANGADTSAATQEFKKIVEESKATMAVATTQKRGPGRPPKNKPTPAPTPSAAAPHLEAPVAPPDISRILVKPLRGISRLPAARYGVPELMLSEEEAQECAGCLNELLKVFVPSVGHMDPRTAAVIGAFSTFGTIGFAKYQIYLVRKAEKNVTPAAPATAQAAGAPKTETAAPGNVPDTQTIEVDDSMFGSRRSATS